MEDGVEVMFGQEISVGQVKMMFFDAIVTPGSLAMMTLLTYAKFSDPFPVFALAHIIYSHATRPQHSINVCAWVTRGVSYYHGGRCRKGSPPPRWPTPPSCSVVSWSPECVFVFLHLSIALISPF